MPDVKIPKEFATRKKLVAIPEQEYRAFMAFINASERELAEVREAEAEILAGKSVSDRTQLKKDLRAALNEVKQGKVVGPFATVDELMKSLDQ